MRLLRAGREREAHSTLWPLEEKKSGARWREKKRELVSSFSFTKFPFFLLSLNSETNFPFSEKKEAMSSTQPASPPANVPASPTGGGGGGCGIVHENETKTVSVFIAFFPLASTTDRSRNEHILPLSFSHRRPALGMRSDARRLIFDIS